MLGILKKFLSRSRSADVPAPVSAPVPPARSAQPSRAPIAVKVVNRNGSPAAAAVPAHRPPAAPQAHRSAQTGFVSVTLSAIEPSLPEPLRHKIASALQEVVPVPVPRLVPQLARGSVTMTVQELRSCAPELLASLSGHDDIPVSLPLSEIIPQLDSSCFHRRQDQRKVQVPEEVLSLFAQTSDGMTILRPAVATAPAQPAPAPAPKRPEPPATPRPAAQPAPRPVTAPVPAAAHASAPAAATAAPKIALSADAMAALAGAAPKKSAAAAATPAAIPMSRSTQQPIAQAPLPATSIAPKANPLPKPATSHATSTAPAALHMQSQAPAAPARHSTPLPAAPTFTPPAAPVRPATPLPAQKTSDNGPKLPLPLEKIASIVPDEVRRELADVDVQGSTISVPMSLVEDALKNGKVLFTWNDLAGWLQPPLPRPPSRIAAEMLVEIPLKVIAPIFMAHHRAANQQRKLDIDEQIPDLFQSGTGQPDARVATPAAAVAQPRPATAEAVSPSRNFEPSTNGANRHGTPLPSLEELIGPENKRFSPKQVIQNATRLPGITGALVAMPDGLPVASIVPPAVKGDTIAAFLPQMFGRMSQYTKELGLGALQSMALNVEGGCWHVFKQPNIYFAVYGKAGEAVPFNLLAQVAAELSKQSM